MLNTKIIIEGESYTGNLEKEIFCPIFRTPYRGLPTIDDDSIEIRDCKDDRLIAKKLVYNDSQVVNNYKFILLKLLSDVLEEEN